MDYQEHDFQYQDDKRKNGHPPRWLELLLNSPVIAALVGGLFCFSISVVITATVDINKLLDGNEEIKTPIAQVESITPIVVTATLEPQGDANTQTPYIITVTSETNPTATPLTPVNATIMEINADVPWLATGIFIDQNDILSITYQQGEWSARVADGPSSWVPPGGYGPAEEFTCIPVPQHDEPEQLGTGPNALIGRIGENGTLFGVLTYSSPNFFSEHISQSGELYLQINDCPEYLNDNAGSIRVLIEVR